MDLQNQHLHVFDFQYNQMLDILFLILMVLHLFNLITSMLFFYYSIHLAKPLYKLYLYNILIQNQQIYHLINQYLLFNM